MNKQSIINSIVESNLNSEIKLYLITIVNNQREEERETCGKEKEEEKVQATALSFYDLPDLANAILR